ncbi:MAG: hypothetical protein AAF490_25320 [Chloroflexota bacterium]
MLRRLLGIIIFIVGLVGIGIAYLLYTQLPPLIDSAAQTVDSTLFGVSQNLDTVNDSLLLAKATLTDLGTTLDTVETSMDQLGQAVNTTTPLLDQIAVVASDDVPESIETVQMAIPDLAQVAGIVDDTLTTLNRFSIDESILGFDINYSLGVNYEPSQPFDETVLALGEGLEGLPGSLRSLQVYTNVTKNNLETVSQNLFLIGDDLGMLNGRVSEIDPLLDEYLQIVTETNDNTRLMRRQISEQWSRLQQIVQFGAIWFGFSQLAPLYLGWELMSGRRKKQ